ncbi:hypothetical protein SPHINGOR109_70050 [Sphingorhabdus sp. 109]|nr:hypothetical protein SPHINGOR109_70050 [Sphingorhabdus sp. 109]
MFHSEDQEAGQCLRRLMLMVFGTKYPALNREAKNGLGRFKMRYRNAPAMLAELALKQPMMLRNGSDLDLDETIVNCDKYCES